jgi:Skp family chaperone for outer membrane proteins
MKMSDLSQNRDSCVGRWAASVAVLLLATFIASSASSVSAQPVDQESLSQQIDKLTSAMARTQAQLQQSQRELDEMRKELTELQQKLVQGGAAAASASPPESAQAPPPAEPASAPGNTQEQIEDLRERQAVEESEIATHEQTKVESESKYPVKVTGMVLMNAFVNTNGVDMAAAPTVALGGPGSVGASIRQSTIGLDARGPRLWGARSFADFRLDFWGSSATESYTSYSGYSTNASGLVRLRTAHAGLIWDKTQLYFALDRPIVSPELPTSLTAVAEPPLAWSGNLWTWNPQAGITHEFWPSSSLGVQTQIALIDPGDAPLTPAIAPTGSVTPTPPNSAEQSSRPGVEARIALIGSGQDENRNHFGMGGYFAPHKSALGRSFDSWAATLDTRLNLFRGLQFSGSAYRGLALGGLGGGGYKDFAFSPNPITGGYYFRALDDVGGWAQLKEKVNERLQFNAAYGMDNVFAYPLRRYYSPSGSELQNLARNRTFSGNVIYAPSAYLLFSLEYRRLESAPVVGLPTWSNVIGLGAGYKF